MENKKYYLVAWDKIKRLLHQGGLGVRSIVEKEAGVEGYYKEKEAVGADSTSNYLDTVERKEQKSLWGA